MPYYHVQIKYPRRNDFGEFRSIPEHELDLSEEEIKTICEQCAADRVFFNGKWIDASTIEEIEIRETPEKTTYYFPAITYSRIFQSSDFPNVTRRFIKLPSKGRTTSTKSERTTQPLSKDIFIVHGRDHEPMKELKTMLLEFGLNPIVLHEQASGGSSTLPEKLEEYSKDVGYAFVILTPDDIGGQRATMRKKLGADKSFLNKEFGLLTSNVIDGMLNNFEPRARQNVIFEMGYFWGLLERKRVCCLLKGNVEKPSDIEGIVYVPFKDSVYEAQVKIMKELKQADYEIKL